ncbi:MAG: histidinol dehydrogenase [Nitrospira sp.]|nr:histidinol dehydrogenase [Nitrospira sp.]
MTALRIRRLATTAADFDAELQRLQQWSVDTDRAIEATVGAIVDDVRWRGDAAVLEYSARFDGIEAASVAALEIARDELRQAFEALPAAQQDALAAAAQRVRHYHEHQLRATSQSWQLRDAEGSLLGQKVTPLDRVGIYVPGGKAAYPSSVLMNAIPAQVAGVGEIVMVVPTPVRREGAPAQGERNARAHGQRNALVHGQRNALVLAAAHLAGVHRVFGIGGAQAVAALAWGTATIPRVDKITGPGNAYVAAAKRRVFGQVGIDMIAGPSEILVLADGSTDPEWVAMDLFSQAEHDELAQSILLSPDAVYLDAVQAALDRLLPSLPRQAVIRASLEGRGALIHTRSMAEACAIANRIAPEHLEISARQPQRWEPLLKHAGAIFLGAFSSESLGDYCAGPNHVLPTAGTARFSSPLGVYDFVKRSSLIEVSAAGAQVLGPVASALAHGEGLQAHARAAELRLLGAVTGGEGASGERAGARAGAGAGAGGAAATGAAGFHLRPVTDTNVDALIKLAVAPEQQGLVAPVAVSLAQASVRPPGRPLAIHDGDQPVGLLLLWDSRRDRDDPADELYVWRLLIDERHQRRGFGTLAMRWVVDEARRLGVASVALSHQMQPGHAGPFYERLGFRYTGVIDDGEHEMKLTIPSETHDG